MKEKTEKKKVKRTSAELLRESFPVAYVRNGLNSTKAYQELKPNVTRESARALAPAILADVSVQDRIRKLLPSEEVESKVIRDALTGDIAREINWTERHKYLETSLKLKGLLNNNQDKSNVNVGIIIER